jgi:hypothetical protein
LYEVAKLEGEEAKFEIWLEFFINEMENYIAQDDFLMELIDEHDM